MGWCLLRPSTRNNVRARKKHPPIHLHPPPPPCDLINWPTAAASGSERRSCDPAPAGTGIVFFCVWSERFWLRGVVVDSPVFFYRCAWWCERVAAYVTRCGNFAHIDSSTVLPLVAHPNNRPTVRRHSGACRHCLQLPFRGDAFSTNTYNRRLADVPPVHRHGGVSTPPPRAHGPPPFPARADGGRAAGPRCGGGGRPRPPPPTHACRPRQPPPRWCSLRHRGAATTVLVSGHRAVAAHVRIKTKKTVENTGE